MCGIRRLSGAVVTGMTEWGVHWKDCGLTWHVKAVHCCGVWLQAKKKLGFLKKLKARMGFAIEEKIKINLMQSNNNKTGQELHLRHNSLQIFNCTHTCVVRAWLGIHLESNMAMCYTPRQISKWYCKVECDKVHSVVPLLPRAGWAHGWAAWNQRKVFGWTEGGPQCCSVSANISETHTHKHQGNSLR